MRISLILFLGLSVTVTTVQTFRVVCNLTVEAKLNSNPTLPCHVEPEMDLTKKFVKWSLVKQEENKTVHIYRKGENIKLEQHEDFRGRTEILTENLKKGDISVTINNVTLNDAGNYTCYVLINKTKNKSSVRLDVTSERETMKGDETGTDVWTVVGIVLVIGAVIVVGIVIWKYWPQCRQWVQERRQNRNSMTYRYRTNEEREQANQEEEQLNLGREPANQEEEQLNLGREPANQEEEQLNLGREPTNQEEEQLNLGREPAN